MPDDSIQPRFSAGLNDEQRVALRACAIGNSLRFEEVKIVEVLLRCGYIATNAAGVAKITATGLKYLQRNQR